MPLFVANSGWIKIYRELLEKPIWALSTPEQKTILITLLLMANHEDKEWEWKGERFICKAGQFITSASSIAKNAGMGISRQNVRTALARFEKHKFLTIISTKQNSLITICNWEIYQEKEIEPNQRANQQLTNELTNELTNSNSLITICNCDIYQEENFATNQRANQQLTNELTNELTTNKNIYIPPISQLSKDNFDISPKGEIHTSFSDGCENPEGLRSNGKFIAPSVDEVTEYCKLKGYTFDPVSFVAFYDSKGWMIGKNKMKSWRSACVTWQKRESEKRTAKSNIENKHPALQPTTEEVIGF